MFAKGNGVFCNNIKNILLIQLGDIGDVVLTLPSISALHEKFPDAKIVVAVRDKAADLIKDCPGITDVISVSKNKRRLWQEISYQRDFFLRLRKFRFDLAIDMRTGTRGALLALLSGARQRIAFYAYDGNLWRNRVFTDLVLPPNKADEYVAKSYFRLMRAFKIKTDSILPKLHILPEKKEQILKLFKEQNIPQNRPVIAVQPFSLWHYKEWSPENYINLINIICSEYNISVVITGSPDERQRAECIAKKCENRIYNLAGKTSIGLFAALLGSCKLFIGGDSAGIHIAAAAGTPTICIFGPSSSGSWAPKGSEHKVIYKNLPCVPCKQKGCDNSEFSRCLKELSVAEVLPVIKEKLSQISRGSKF